MIIKGMKYIRFFLISFLFLLFACSQQAEELPILSKKKAINGEISYEKIPDFRFINQDSTVVTNADFEDNIYVADFFFTHCPSICPLMHQQMMRLYERFEQDRMLRILSHTIDPKRDTVGRLKYYAENLGVQAPKWHFVTGQKDELYSIADYYYTKVVQDQNLPEGFDHSGRFILIDQDRHIRAYCNGTDPEEVDAFMEKIEILLNEKK